MIVQSNSNQPCYSSLLDAVGWRARPFCTTDWLVSMQHAVSISCWLAVWSMLFQFSHSPTYWQHPAVLDGWKFSELPLWWRLLRTLIFLWFCSCYLTNEIFLLDEGRWQGCYPWSHGAADHLHCKGTIDATMHSTITAGIPHVSQCNVCLFCPF